MTAGLFGAYLYKVDRFEEALPLLRTAVAAVPASELWLRCLTLCLHELGPKFEAHEAAQHLASVTGFADDRDLAADLRNALNAG